MHLIEVAFKGNRKEFFVWESDDLPKLKAPIIVDADRGEDLGHVHAIGDLAAKRSAGCAHGCGTEVPSRKARRLASTDEVKKAEQLKSQDDDARRKAMERVKAHDLGMKITDAEWQWDRKKLTFYFTAEKRVDFRTLVRELAAMFRTRIELKQIGVRDEAKRLDGIGRCGRQYCSSSWLPDLRPVNLGVAKDQRLSLNPAQISGACGRLMCCLRYEHEFYIESRRRFPKEGRIVRSARGEEKVIANDIFGERVTLRAVDGETRVIPLAEFRAELSGSGTATLEPAMSGDLPFASPGEAEEDAIEVASGGSAADAEDEVMPEEEGVATSAGGDAAEPGGERKRGSRRRGRRGGRRGRGQTGGGGPESGPAGGGGNGVAAQ